MKTLPIVLGMTLAISNGMAHAAMHDDDMSQLMMSMQVASSDAGHEGVGVLKAVNAKAGKVQIAHEAIATLGWPPMTMWFAVHDTLSRDIRVGDTVRFELKQGAKNQWVITKIEHN